MLLRFNSLFSWFIQRCPKWSSVQHLWGQRVQRTETSVCLNMSLVYILVPFSSGRSPPLVWGQSAPSRSGSSQCGMESSCRGWCGRERDTCVSSSWGPCWPGCVRWPESPHPDPKIKIIQKNWWEPKQIQHVIMSWAIRVNHRLLWDQCCLNRFSSCRISTVS